MAGCSGDNLAKTESAIEAMADGEGKIAAQKEVAAGAGRECSAARWVMRSASEQAMHVARRSKLDAGGRLRRAIGPLIGVAAGDFTARGQAWLAKYPIVFE